MLAALTAILFYNVGHSNGETVGQKTANTNTYSRQADQEMAEKCLDPEPAAMAECISEILKATNEDQRAERDVVAQEAMALWALAMTLVTTIGAGATIVGAIFVWRTLKATQATVAEAQESNRIAKAANAVDQRSWLTIETPTIVRIWISPPEPDSSTEARLNIEYQLTLKNTGRTPALYLWLEAHFGRSYYEDWKRLWERADKDLLRPQKDGWCVAPEERLQESLTGVLDFYVPDRGEEAVLQFDVKIAVSYAAVNDDKRFLTASTFSVGRAPYPGSPTWYPLVVNLPQVEALHGEVEGVSLEIDLEGVEFHRHTGTMT